MQRFWTPSLLLLLLTSMALAGAVPQAHLSPNLPLAFEPNHGQAAADVQFVARGAGYTILVRRDGDDFLLRGKDGGAATIHVRLLGASAAGVNPESALETRVNYLLGGDPAKWLTNLPTYQRVRLSGVYRATDLVYYGNQGQLEYDFVVRPGGNADTIAFTVEGADVKALPNGDLALRSGKGEVVWHKPVAYQLNGGKRVPVAAGYRMVGNRVSFAVGRYDRTRELVIDPALAYSTYFGGSSDDHADAIAVDASGNAYITGQTRSSDLPTTSGAFDRTCGADGACDNTGDGPQADAFVMKLNPTGTRVVYATYVGGNDYDEAFAIAVDKGGNAYVAGETFSSDFFADFHLGAGRPSHSFGVAFVLKLRSDGAGPLYGTTIGGTNGNGASINGIQVDASGNAYFAGVTDASDFPTTAGAFQAAYGGAPSGTGGDAFVGKLNAAGSAFVWASYLGGSLRDTAEDIAIDSSGNAYVTGWTSSADFPTTAGAYRTTLPSHPPSGFDPTSAFVTKVSAGGASLAYSTYLGGTLFDAGYGIAVASGNAYVTGIAQSSDFPTTTGAVSRTLKGLADAFVTKLNTTGTGLAYSTLLGGTSDERGTGIAVNSSGIAYATGVTYSTDFPTNSYGFQQLFGGTEDIYVTQLNATGTGFAFSSYLGGSATENDQAKSRIVLLGSNAFVSGSTMSTDFPVTPDAAQKTSAGNFDAFVARIAPLCSLNTANPSVTICAPAAGASVQSPVEVRAGTHDSHRVKQMQVWIDGAKAYQANLAALDVRLPMSTGTHRIAVLAIDTAGAIFKSAVNVTVGTSPVDSTCTSPGTPRTVDVCGPSSPTSNPVHLFATFQPGSTPTTRAQVYMDGGKIYDVAASALHHNSDGSLTLDTHLTVPTGTHRFTYLGVDGQGTYGETIYQIQVQ